MAEVNEVSKLGSRASRKRSSQDVDDFLPCKRYRLDMNVVGNNHAIGYESPTIKAINNRSNSKRLIKHGKSSRYYRPMFRLLRSVKVDTTIDADVSNILRQFREKSFAREIVKNDDGLFGSSTSHSPACTFRGWTPNIKQLKSPLAAQDTDNSLICSSPAEVIVGMNMPSHASNVTKMKETPRKVVDVGCQCNMYINTLTEHKIDGSNIPSSPSEGVTSTIDIPSNVTTSCVGSEPKTPSQGLPSSNLIFDFMPVNTPIIPRSIKHSSLSTPKHGSVTLRRLPLSLQCVSHQLRLHASFRTPAVKAVMRSRHLSQSAGAITPRNNRPSIARYIQSTLATTATPTFQEEESIITPSLSSSSSYATLEDNDSMHHVERKETTSPFLDGIASIGKRVLRYTAERLRGCSIKVQSSEEFQTTAPSNFQPQASLTTSNDSPRYLLQQGISSTSSHLPTPRRLQFPPSSSDRSFLTSNNDRNDSFNRNHASTKPDIRAATTPHLVKNPTNLLPCPPKGWENLFQPKHGEWKCKLCYYMNPVDAKTCDSCTAIDDRYSSLGTQSSLGRAVSKNTAVTPCETTTIGNNGNVNETVGHKSRVAAPTPVSILRNGKSSQRRTTVGSGKRFKQDNADLMDVG